MPRFSKLLKEKKNFIFIGETGSGKSEIALNTAVLLREGGERGVHLFDMDQTKAMFRARDAEAQMRTLGVEVHYMPQLLDMPVLVNGIIPHLMRKDSACILDVGGNENAARMVGCLSDHLNGENTAAVYVLNPYRPWSGTVEQIRETMETVLSACHIERVYFAANPTVGADTTEETVTQGLRRLTESIPARELTAVFVTEGLCLPPDEASGLERIPLRPYLRYPWLNEKERTFS